MESAGHVQIQGPLPKDITWGLLLKQQDGTTGSRSISRLDRKSGVGRQRRFPEVSQSFCHWSRCSQCQSPASTTAYHLDGTRRWVLDTGRISALPTEAVNAV